MNKRILFLAVPAIFNNITVPLLGLSDTTIAGHLGSASFLAAMAVGSMMLNVIFWLCGFLRMGTTGLTSQAYGAGVQSMTRVIFKKSITIAIFISVFVLVLQRPLEKVLFWIIAPDESVSRLASLYFRICLWGAPAQLVIMAVSGWFIGLQNTVIPMVVAVGVNIINILLSISLVFVFNMGFAGVATGTLAANWIGLAGALLFVYNKMRRQIKEEKSAVKNNGETDKAGSMFEIKNSTFFKVNTDLFFRSACIMVVTLAMTSYGSRLGETTLAANAVIMQFFLFFSYFMDGFAFAGEAIVGSSLGARDYSTLRRSVRILLLWGVFISLAFLLIYLFGSAAITSLLTTDIAVRDGVDAMKLWLVVMPPVTVAAFIFDGVFIGLARTRALLVTTLMATLVYFIIIWSAQGSIDLTNAVLWLAFGIYLLLRGILLGLNYMKLQRKVLIL